MGSVFKGITSIFTGGPKVSAPALPPSPEPPPTEADAAKEAEKKRLSMRRAGAVGQQETILTSSAGAPQSAANAIRRTLGGE